MKFPWVSLTLLVLLMSPPLAAVAAPANKPPDDGAGGDGKQIKFSGNVSWYGMPFHGRETASGMICDMNKLTSAHRTLPFYTKVLVENPKTRKTVLVSVTDRGP
jgi:rare lipoprotein A (peptidoglycan hydrolase)